MKYRELRDRLAALEGRTEYPYARSDAVYFGLYDKGKNRRTEDNWHIEIHDGQYHVGYVERGEFDRRNSSATEEEACDWLYAHLTRPQTVGRPVSREELDAVAARMKARYAAQDAERASRENVQPPHDAPPEAADRTPWYRRIGRKGDDP